MHENTYPLVNKAIHEKKLRGNDLACEYNPCHTGLEDCTFCYCPFYPCNDPSTGGKNVISSTTGKPIWDCSFCIFPHIRENAQLILEKLLELGRDLEEITRKELLKIRKDILQQSQRLSK